MQEFIKHFRREAAGIWVCISAAGVQLQQVRIEVAPGTRFQRGTKFMNLDIAALLDEQYARDQLKASPLPK